MVFPHIYLPAFQLAKQFNWNLLRICHWNHGLQFATGHHWRPLMLLPWIISLMGICSRKMSKLYMSNLSGGSKNTAHEPRRMAIAGFCVVFFHSSFLGGTDHFTPCTSVNHWLRRWLTVGAYGTSVGCIHGLENEKYESFILKIQF